MVILAAMPNDNPHLKRFGSLFLDPQTITAVGPIYFDDDMHIRGYRVVTIGGGAIDVIDEQSVAAVTRWLEAEIT